ncbi:MAG: hypothetical protein C0501_13990 [Isosphaera sp.]|nr:hypothetical protein [Isosphaera sp.]
MRLRLVLGLMFLVLAAAIFTRAWTAPDLDARFDPVRMNLGGVLALVFGGLNLARWYAAYSYRQARRTPVRTPLQPDPSAAGPEPPNPDLDFSKRPSEPDA